MKQASDGTYLLAMSRYCKALELPIRSTPHCSSPCSPRGARPELAWHLVREVNDGTAVLDFDHETRRTHENAPSPHAVKDRLTTTKYGMRYPTG